MRPSPVPAVGDFKALVAWAEEDTNRCEAVKRMLKLSRSWEEAREHAMKVRVRFRYFCCFGVANDGWLRGWVKWSEWNVCAARCGGHELRNGHRRLSALCWPTLPAGRGR